MSKKQLLINKLLLMPGEMAKLPTPDQSFHTPSEEDMYISPDHVRHI